MCGSARLGTNWLLWVHFPFHFGPIRSRVILPLFSGHVEEIFVLISSWTRVQAQRTQCKPASVWESRKSKFSEYMKNKREPDYPDTKAYQLLFIHHVNVVAFIHFFFLSFFLSLMCSSFVTVVQSSKSGQRSESIFDFCFLDCLGCELRCSWSPKNRQYANWLFEYRLLFFGRRLNARPSGFVTMGWGQENFWSHICIVDIELKMYIVS